MKQSVGSNIYNIIYSVFKYKNQLIELQHITHEFTCESSYRGGGLLAAHLFLKTLLPLLSPFFAYLASSNAILLLSLSLVRSLSLPSI